MSRVIYADCRHFNVANRLIDFVDAQIIGIQMQEQFDTVVVEMPSARNVSG
ncbi:MAG: hypothetical protein P4L80_17225 [Xanthobacteraceae bacterium]|nr:hypothetical protein [Xanthobacteraceae bacterium]